MNQEMLDFQFKYSPYIPYDPSINPHLAAYTTHPCMGGVQPYVYTNWRDEELSWHENCYLHAGLNPASTLWFKGPDALRMLSENCTNGFKSFAIGKARHCVMVNEEGFIMQDGLVIRLAEDEFLSYWMLPYIDWVIDKGDYDIETKNITGDVFMHQLGGPRSLEILEATTGEDFHDLPFVGHRLSSIDGRDVRVIRIGMAGSLAYEVHGEFADSIPVYNALLKAGKPYGIRRLGRHAYWNVHTEAGFPQFSIHFFYSWDKDEGFFKYLMDNGGAYGCGPTSELNGSMGPDIEARRFNPIELGWERMISFEHDFVGKEALQKIMESPHREMRTLVWNPEDILEIWKSEFEQGEPYAPLEGPEDVRVDGVAEYIHDKILKNGKTVGISSGRVFSWKFREMLSLGIVDPEVASLGTEVTILWGNPGTRQKEIRAIVSRFPYLDEDRNENVDLSTIPSGLSG